MHPARDEPSMSGFLLPEGAAAQAIRRLAAVTTELSAAETLTDVVTAAVTHGATAIGAAVTTLMLVRGDRIELVAGANLQPGVEDQWHTFGLADANPSSEAARSGRPVLVASHDEVLARYPVLSPWARPGRSLVALPFGGRPATGVLGLTFENNYLPGENELDLLLTFAGGCGQALSRIESSELAKRRAADLAFLAEASAELARSLDYRATLANVAQLVVPWLADWCTVDVVLDGAPTTLAVAHADAAKAEWAYDQFLRFPYAADAPTGAPYVLRSGESQLYEHITEELVDATVADEPRRRLMRDLHMRSAVVVPLSTAGGKVLGALSLVRTDSSRAFGRAELALAEDLGRRAGAAIDNARLYEASRSAALQLQSAVLPASLADLKHWEVAAHYAPGGTLDVGGDFYDAIELPNGRLAVMLGDVMGHGIVAAAAMAQVRAATRAFLSYDPDPTAVMSKLDNMYRMLGTTQLITMIYGVLDSDAHRFTFVNAGHYPPMVLMAQDSCFAHTDPRLPLGISADDRSAATVDFGESDTLLLYTDGLIEHRGEILDAGLARLAAAAGELADAALPTGLAALVAALDCSDDDDVTAFAVRWRP